MLDAAGVLNSGFGSWFASSGYKVEAGGAELEARCMCVSATG